MARDKDDDEVGYKKPPKAFQFKPGQSGNPSGRRKAPPDFASDLADEMREPIMLRENGRERRVTKQRAFIKALTSLAIKGDIRAINALVACARNFAPDHTAPKGEELDPEDLDILENFIRRKRKTGEDAERESSKATNGRKRRDHRN
jgi:Family of unknown function (DUF5681)